MPDPEPDRDTVMEMEAESRRDAGEPRHNYEYGREHGGYSHVGIPPDCPACAAERRDRAFPVADEDVTFADPDGSSGLDSWDWPPPPGRRPPLSFGEEQANIINATGA